jgi:UTP-glucose-1-phosphate uridylyltransferase
LVRLGKQKALDSLEVIHSRATFSFVEQPENAGYGTAVPLLVAIPHLPKNEAIFVAGGDDFIWHTDGRSEVADFIKDLKTMNRGAIRHHRAGRGAASLRRACPQPERGARFSR